MSPYLGNRNEVRTTYTSTISTTNRDKSPQHSRSQHWPLGTDLLFHRPNPYAPCTESGEWSESLISQYQNNLSFIIISCKM